MLALQHALTWHSCGSCSQYPAGSAALLLYGACRTVDGSGVWYHPVVSKGGRSAKVGQLCVLLHLPLLDCALCCAASCRLACIPVVEQRLGCTLRRTQHCRL